MFRAFLIKYGEIGIKGKNRFIFENALCDQIRFALKDVEGTFEVTKEQGRIYVEVEGEYDYEETVDALTRVFGITAICPVKLVDNADWDNLTKEVAEYVCSEERSYGVAEAIEKFCL